MLSTGHKRIRKAVSLPHLRIRSDLEPFPSIMRTEPYMFSQRSPLHTQVNLTLSILRKNSSVFLAPDSEFQGLLLLCHFLASAWSVHKEICMQNDWIFELVHFYGVTLVLVCCIVINLYCHLHLISRRKRRFSAEKFGCSSNFFL